MTAKKKSQSACWRCNSILCETGIDNVQYSVGVIYHVELGDNDTLTDDKYDYIDNSYGLIENTMNCRKCGADIAPWSDDLAISILKEGK